MKSLKAALWILVGVCVGATAFGSTPLVQAQQNPGPTRLKVIPAGFVDRSSQMRAEFLYDGSSTGCWLAIWHYNGLELAPAPDTARK